MSNHTTPPPEAKQLPTESDYASALCQRPVPYFSGRRRIPLNWVTDVFGVESIKTPTTSAGGKGGGSKKGGGSNSQKTYYSSIVGVVAHGPADYMLGLESDNDWQDMTWSGALARSGDHTDLTPADSTDLLTGGKIRLYWGTETQTVDPGLSGQPNYAGYTYFFLNRFKMGPSRGTPRGVCAIMARKPVVDTSIVASGSNTFSADGQYQINPIAAMAEIFLAPWGFNWPTSRLDATSWLAESAYIWANRQAYAECSCFFDTFEAARAKLPDLMLMADVALRWLPNGKLGLARVLPGYVPSNAAVFDARHFRDGAPMKPKGQGLSNLATRVQVDFLNSDSGNNPILWKNDTVQATDLWALQTMDFVANPLKISRPFVGIVAQAQMHGTEAMRRLATPPLTATAFIRSAEVAVGSDGNPVQVGDKHYFDIDPAPGGGSQDALAVVRGRTDYADGTVDLELEFDGSAQVVPQFPSWTGATYPGISSASIAHALVVPQFPNLVDANAAVYVLATRPNTSIHGFKAFFGKTTGGDFVELGSEDGFAARAGLVSDITNAATTVRLSITDGDSGPDGYLAGQAPQNATAAQSDLLLAILCHVDGNGAIINSGGEPVMEFVSLVSRTAVSAGVYDYTVLRGRQDTVPAAWTAAGTVAWIVPLSHLIRWALPAMDDESGTGDTNYVRLASYTIGAEDQTVPLPGFAVKFPALPLATGDTSILTNDFDLCPSAADGSSPVLTHSVTTMKVYENETDTTGTWSFSAAPSTGVTGSLSGSTYNVAGFTADNGFVDITATKAGHANQVQRFVIAKAKQGVNAAAYWLIFSASAINKSAGGVYTPANVTFSIVSQTGTGGPVAYSGRFIIEEDSGAGFVTVYTSGADENTKTYTPSAGIKTLKCRAFLAGGTVTLLDYQVIPVVSDGTNGSNGTNGTNGVNGRDGGDLVLDPDFTLGGTDGWDSAFGWWTFANNFGQFSWGAKLTGTPTQMVNLLHFRTVAGERYSIRAKLYGVSCYCRITFFDISNVEMGYITAPARGAASWGFVEALGAVPVGAVYGRAEVLGTAVNCAVDSVKVTYIPPGLAYNDPASTVPPVLMDYNAGTDTMTLRNDDGAATIKYRINGGTLTTYSAPFSAAASDVVQAYAERGGYTSSQDSKLTLP